jgi:cytochrome c oxidase cbb3-type subunit III
MSASRGHVTAALRAAVLLALAASCQREERRFRESPPSAMPAALVRVSPLQPGPTYDSTHLGNVYQENAYAVTEGQRLFNWYNCSGCHANGGGGPIPPLIDDEWIYGSAPEPPLIDDEWIYGSAPEQVYSTIVQGRPNGMPSFGSRVPTPQVWMLVAYVRSLSGQTPSYSRSARADHMMNTPGSQSLVKPATPKSNSRPPGGEIP